MFTTLGLSAIFLAFITLFVNSNKFEAWLLRGAVLGIVVFMLLLNVSPYYVSVPSGCVGVQTTFGKVMKENSLSDGWYILPAWRDVVKLDLRTQKYSTAITVRSKDQQKVVMKLSVNYAINPERVIDVVEHLIEDGDTTILDEHHPDEYHQSDFGKSVPEEVGKSHGDIINKVLIPMLYEVVNKGVANYGIAQIMGKRATIRDEFLMSLRNEIEQDKYGFLIISDILIDDIDFSDKYEKAIIAKASVVQQIQQTEYDQKAAEASAEKKRQEGIGVKNVEIEKANGIATAKLSEGENTAKSIIAKATAQAEGYEKLAESYTSTILALDVLEKWDGKLPTVSIDVSGGNGSASANPTQSGQQPILILPQPALIDRAPSNYP